MFARERSLAWGQETGHKDENTSREECRAPLGSLAIPPSPQPRPKPEEHGCRPERAWCHPSTGLEARPSHHKWPPSAWQLWGDAGRGRVPLHVPSRISSQCQPTRYTPLLLSLVLYGGNKTLFLGGLEAMSLIQATGVQRSPLKPVNTAVGCRCMCGPYSTRSFSWPKAGDNGLTRPRGSKF